MRRDLPDLGPPYEEMERTSRILELIENEHETKPLLARIR